jgi:copper chaperone CopZ
MSKITFDVPAMYADHHVLDVRRLLLELPGVKDVYASSAFRIIEVTTVKGKVTKKQIQEKLDEAGYLGELEVAEEANVAATEKTEKPRFFRHTELFEETSDTVSFAQKVGFEGRPLWPCPGMGPVKKQEMVD